VRVLLALRRDLWRAADDRVPCARWQDVRVYRYRGRLYAERASPPPVAERRSVTAEGVALPLGGHLRLRATIGRGLSRVRLPAPLELRPRRGGESFHPAEREHRRPLRKWLQEAGVLPWLRNHVPLIYAGEELVYVADLAWCAEYAARAGEESWEVCWRNRPVLTEAEALRSARTDDGRAR
jgi:tRNA(Ile)-lysidine synthase